MNIRCDPANCEAGTGGFSPVIIGHDSDSKIDVAVKVLPAVSAKSKQIAVKK